MSSSTKSSNRGVFQAMPPLETMQNDEAFLTLLSSQRELLSQLNREAAQRRAPNNPQVRHFSKPRRGSILAFDPHSLMNRPIIEKRGSMLGADPFLLLNRPNSASTDRRSSLDMIFSKRFSLGLGNDNYMLPAMFPDAERYDQDDSSMKEFKGDLDFGDAMLRRMKRRRSSMGLSHFLDDQKQSRRLSILSISSKTVDKCDDKLPLGTFSFGEQSEPPSKRFRIDPNIDLSKLKNTMEACANAMEKSAQSQQDIHNWDRKMGLKKSHSKTMRLSSRSRKKLRTAFKKEIILLEASSL